MGSCNFKSDSDMNSYVSKNNFQFHYCIGRGGFGKVWKVEHKKNKNICALKEMSKTKIITKRSINSVMNERHLLSILRHPFLVNMITAFQDRENLYLIMDLMPGGDLRYHINTAKKFTEFQTKFFICCLITSLEHLHSNGVLHRDVKPENLVFDNQGYLRLTDLGIARIWKAENANETSGTPGYMAPEVMCRQNHGVAVDYYAMGVLAYELMMGKRPYIGRNRKEIRDQILAKQVQIKKNDIPDGWSLEAADFINRLIQRKPINRLGLNGPEEVKAHLWINKFPWEKLVNKELDSPFLPNENKDNFDLKRSQDDPLDDTENEIQKQNAIQLRRNSVQNLFIGYDYECSSTNVNTAVTSLKQKGSMNQNTQSSSATQISSKNEKILFS